MTLQRPFHWRPLSTYTSPGLVLALSDRLIATRCLLNTTLCHCADIKPDQFFSLTLTRHLLNICSDVEPNIIPVASAYHLLNTSSALAQMRKESRMALIHVV
jgi:hypothetical protein